MPLKRGKCKYHCKCSLSLKVEGEKNHKKGGLNCVFKNFSSLRSEKLYSGSESEIVQSLREFRVVAADK